MGSRRERGEQWEVLAARAFECRALGLRVPGGVGWMDGVGVRLEVDTIKEAAARVKERMGHKLSAGAEGLGCASKSMNELRS